MKFLLPGLAALALIGSVRADDPPADLKAALDKSVAYLKTRQGEDGSFAPKLGGPGVTALIAAGLIRNGYTPDDPLVASCLKYVEKYVQKDGGIYVKGLANYVTCVALVAFKEANKNGRYDAVIAGASKFLKSLQGEPGDESDTKFGGVGYDNASRPDLSNTQFFVEALLASGVSKDDPAVKNALKFISRCQNLPGETNDRPFAKKTTEDDKGGLTYNPADADSEKSPNRTPNGGLRSAGTMTYAGLKSFLYAGLNKDDPRVKAAVDWIGRHYTLDENPGAGQAGLYYYYHLFAKAMDALGEDTFTDAKGVKHNWRQELAAALLKRQRPDGSWVNDSKAFQENVPELCTAYAILSLSYCKKK
ncbi:MAG: prenyltransferase/squalene oxidase repeat-containing protein [Gemmataceae bacterium]